MFGTVASEPIRPALRDVMIDEAKIIIFLSMILLYLMRSKPIDFIEKICIINLWPYGSMVNCSYHLF